MTAVWRAAALRTLFLLSIALSLSVAAHDLTDRSVEGCSAALELKFWRRQATVDYWLRIGDIEASRVRQLYIDRDHDGSLSEPERKLFVDGLRDLLVKDGFLVELSTPGQTTRVPLQLEFYSGEFPPGWTEPIKVNFQFIGDLPPLGPGSYAFYFATEHVFPRPAQLRLFLAQDGNLQLAFSERQQSQYEESQKGKNVGLGDVLEAFGTLGIPQEFAGAEKPDFGARPQPEASGWLLRQYAQLRGYVSGREPLSAAVLLGIFGISFLLGMGHALAPGHGKTMVAAYLIGSEGTLRHALFLGIVVTFTHTWAVVVAALAFQFVQAEMRIIELWTGIAGGAGVFGIGLYLVATRIRQAPHAHSHSHAHPHGHEHPYEHAGSGTSEPLEELAPLASGSSGSAVTLRQLVSLGITGGIVPCPTAIALLLASLAAQRTTVGLLAILVFAVGLASVLILIGILMVSASQLLHRFEGTGRWLRYLGLGSAAIITLVGVGLVLQTLLFAGYLTIEFPGSRWIIGTS